MQHIIDLTRYPLDRPDTDDWRSLTQTCQSALDRDGLFNLPGFLRPEAVTTAAAELKPTIDTASFNHSREHNIYFKKSIDGLPDDHPALRLTKTANHTICADQMGEATVIKLYEWPPSRPSSPPSWASPNSTSWMTRSRA